MHKFNNNSTYIFCFNVFYTNNVKFIDYSVPKTKPDMDIAIFKFNVAHDMIILAFLKVTSLLILLPPFKKKGFWDS